MICKHCDKECQNPNSHRNHERLCPANPLKQISNLTKRRGTKSWNSGQTKFTNAKLAEIGKRISATNTGHTHNSNESTKEKLRKIAHSQGLGGYVQGGGRGKKGYYKGFWCDSSWELAYVLYNLDHQIGIARCKEVRTYKWAGKTRTYFPDFVVEGRIVEIKGYNSLQWEAKHTANPDVVVMFYPDLLPILTYVKKMYGKNFTRLYEK